MTLDRTKLIRLPSGNTLKWDGKFWVGECEIDPWGKRETQFDDRWLRWTLGDTIEQIEPDWRDGIDGADWKRTGADGLFLSNGDQWGFAVHGNGEVYYAGKLFAKFPTPALAVKAINELLEKATPSQALGQKGER